MINREIFRSSTPSALATELLYNLFFLIRFNLSTLFPGVFASKKMVVIRAFNSPHRILGAKLNFTHKFFGFFGFGKKSIRSKPRNMFSFLSSPVSINPLIRDSFASSTDMDSVRFENISNDSSIVSSDRLHDESVGSFLNHVPLIELLFSTGNRLRFCHLEGTI